MSERIADLEATNERTDGENRQLFGNISEILAAAKVARAGASVAAADADRLEAIAETHRLKADGLHAKLATSSEDLDRIADTVGRLLRRYE